MEHEKVSKKEEKAILEAAHRFLGSKPKTFDEQLMQDLQAMSESWMQAYKTITDANVLDDLGFKYTQFSSWVRNGYQDGYSEWFRVLAQTYQTQCTSLQADIDELEINTRNDNELLVQAQNGLEELQDEIDTQELQLAQMKADAEKFGSRREAVKTLVRGKKK